MKQYLTFLFCLLCFYALTQNNQGTISYNGRVTHMYDEDNYQIEIPYEKQNSKGVMAAIYFDSSNIKIDLMATIAYTLTVTHQKEQGWLLYLERFGSKTVAKTTMYDDMEIFVFDSLEFNYDTTKTIAGYSCKLARYQLAGIKYELWFTNEINLGSNLLPIPDEISGACLEFTIQLEIADIRYTAYEIDLNTPNPKRFEMVIPEKYILTEEALFPVKQMQSHEVKMNQIDSEIPPPPIIENH